MKKAATQYRQSLDSEIILLFLYDICDLHGLIRRLGHRLGQVIDGCQIITHSKKADCAVVAAAYIIQHRFMQHRRVAV